jgi:hypothetical protein
MPTNGLLGLLLVPMGILLIPLTAMLLGWEGWHWRPGSFVVAWVLLTGVGLAYRLLARQATSRSFRSATALALVSALALVWINGAVGLIGSEANPANLLYGGVLAVGLAGALVARLKPAGLARALLATALAQLLVPVVALVFWPDDFSPGLVPVFGANLLFALSFAVSGWLFRRAAGKPAKCR